MTDDNLPESNASKLIKGGLRSIAASVPVAASLAQAWTEYDTHMKSERIDRFFHLLREQIVQHEERIRLAEQYIKYSGELPELLEKAVSCAQRTSSEEKIKRFATSFVSSIAAKDTINVADKLTLLDTLDSLTEQDIHVLSFFTGGTTIRVDQIFQQWHLQETNRELRLGQLIVSLSKLESRGIIGETVPERFDVVIGGVGDPASWYNRWRARFYVLLPFGRTFVESISGK